MRHPFAGRILVTGAAGFIGSALIWGLNQRGLTNILAVDRLGQGPKWRNLVPLSLADYQEVEPFRRRLLQAPNTLSDVSLVLHMGACSATTETDASYLIDNNYQTTCELIEWALERDVRMVYASSAATYGDGSHGYADGEADLSRLRPLNAYGFSKHLLDRKARREGWLDRVVGLKYFNVFGPNENHKGDMRSLVHKAFEQVRSVGSVRLFRSHNPNFADGHQQRDFLYVKDAVAMTLHLAEHPEAAGLFNLGSGQARPWLDLVGAIFAALDLTPRIEFIDMPAQLRETYQYHTCADLSRLRQAGYQRGLTELSEAVMETVRDYLVDDRRLGDA